MLPHFCTSLVNKIDGIIFKTKISRHYLFLWAKTTPFLTLLFILLIAFFRKPDAFLNPQFWAEDGTIFFKYSYELGFKSIFLPYAGYMHLIPWLIAYAASFFPFSVAPIIYNYSSLAAVLFVCSKIFDSRLRIPHKPLFAVAIVLVPYSFLEGFMNVANVQIYLAPLLLILSIQEPPVKKYQLLLDYSILVLVGLTGIFIIFSLPLFLYKCVVKRTAYNYCLCFIAILLAIIHIYFIKTILVFNDCFIFKIDHWVAVFGFRLFGDIFFGRQIALSINLYLLGILSIACPILIIILTKFNKNRLYLVCSFLYFGTSIVFAAFVKFRSCPGVLISQYAGQHYFYIFTLMLMWALIVCLDSGKTRKWISQIMLVLILLSSLTSFQQRAFKDHHWKEYSKKIGKGLPLKIPINPGNHYIDIK